MPSTKIIFKIKAYDDDKICQFFHAFGSSVCAHNAFDALSNEPQYAHLAWGLWQGSELIHWHVPKGMSLPE